jgi:ketosteroid isomerase-like protein
MRSQDNTAVVQGMYEAFRRGDVQVILDGLSADVTWSVQGPASVPLFGTRRGPAEVAGFFQAVGRYLRSEQFAPREFLAIGNRVVVLGHEAGRVAATGAHYEGDWVHLFTFDGGKVVDFREFSDTAALAQAFHATRAAA